MERTWISSLCDEAGYESTAGQIKSITDHENPRCDSAGGGGFHDNSDDDDDEFYADEFYDACGAEYNNIKLNDVMNFTVEFDKGKI